MLTEHGVYIFKLDGICFLKGSQQLTDHVRNLLTEEKIKKEYKLWVRSLRQKAYIEIMD
jgi:peptidyl-prolyl cis-trans isomerase SurA